MFHSSYTAKLNAKSLVGKENFTMVRLRLANLLYFLPGVRLGNFTLWMYCCLFSFPPLTNSVEIPFAVIINSLSQYTTMDASVSFAVFHVTNTSVKVPTPNKTQNN